MPTLKIERITSFSSEDKVHVANNLLGNITSSKWKCASPGEKQAVVCLQLEKASVISGIDIGNEHSAYIEVLVSRSGSDDDYKSFLVMSSFMSSLESRQSTNINRVRMFKTADFTKPQSEEKWDRIKVVCTQPFNRHVKYGLSFIKFLSNDGEKENANDGEIKLGKFTLKPEAPTELDIGSMFARRKELEADKDKPLTAAATLRNAEFSLFNGGCTSPVRSPKLLPDCLRNSTSKTKTKDVPSTESTPKPRHRKELFYTEEDEKPNEKIDRLFEKQKAEKLKKMEEDKIKTPQSKNKIKTDRKEKTGSELENKGNMKTPSRDKPSKEQPSGSKPERETAKRKHQDVAENSPKKMKPSRITKPFERLLEDVVLVISGIQNPDRATLRGQILEMGGKYKPDWDNTCTHLVCAFMNTPKFVQVKGKGKIVTRQWVEECFSQKKKLPWRRYALDKQERKKEESEDEIWEQIQEVRIVSPTIVTDGPNFNYEDIIEPASDTEDIIDQIRNKKLNDSSIQDVAVSPEPSPQCSEPAEVPLKETVHIPEIKEDKIYSAETDTEEETVERKQLVKNKPFDFFKNMIFYVDTNFEDCIDETIKNFIFIHDGIIVDDPSEKLDYMICGSADAPDLHAVNTEGICILPDWVIDCHKCKQFIPPDEYFVL